MGFIQDPWVDANTFKLEVSINRAFRYLKNPWVVTIALIVFGAALRIWPLGILGIKVTWLTYYPTVMVAAVYGGMFAGLAGAVLACLIVIFLWPVFVSQPFLQTFADWLGAAVFFLNCALISYIAELMRRAQRKAKRAQEEAEAANKAKSVFLSNMSHELRTPLNAILGFSRILNNDSNVTQEQKANLGIITRSGEHLLQLINNILDIAKIESGKIVLEESDTDLYSLLQEVHSLMNVRATEKELDFTSEQSSDLPRFITVDSGKLRQVLINLVGNAIKYTASGKIIIRTVVVKNEVSQKVRLRFEVEDTGTGIRLEDREKLFMPFVQIGGRDSKVGGTGLGLTISKQNVELMGGQIGVSGEFNKGSLFYFEIPVTLAQASSVPNVPQSSRIIRLADGQPHYRLLIVEDQPDSRLLLKKLLEPLGFDLREAVNGQEALSVFEEWHPALIWMDIRMPVMGGIEATKRIKQTLSGKGTKIIALTAHALSEERSEILAAGCDDFIRKPYHSNEIFDALTKHLGARFMYAEDQMPVSDKVSEKELAELMTCLAPALILDLKKAAEELDGQSCNSIINQVSEISLELGESLRSMVDDLEYKELLSTLDNILSRGNV